ESPRPIAAGSHRILVVDDNVDAAESLAVLLRLWRFDVFTAYDGAAAIEAIGEHDPDAVLLDLGLPEADGFTVLRSARERTPDRRRLWIAVSGYGQTADRTRTRDAGFDAHMVKPVEMDGLR